MSESRPNLSSICFKKCTIDICRWARTQDQQQSWGKVSFCNHFWHIICFGLVKYYIFKTKTSFKKLVKIKVFNICSVTITICKLIHILLIVNIVCLKYLCIGQALFYKVMQFNHVKISRYFVHSTVLIPQVCLGPETLSGLTFQIYKIQYCTNPEHWLSLQGYIAVMGGGIGFSG